MRTRLGRGVCLITYHPAWARDVPELERHQYKNGEGTEEQRVAYADQQTGYHDMRVTLCLSAGLTVDQIHPVTGHALTTWPEDTMPTTPSDYAAKLAAENVTDLSDASLAAVFAHCVRPARPGDYDAIRDAYRVGYLAGYEKVATLPLFGEVTP